MLNLTSVPPVVFPPLDGSLTISDVVDFNIQQNSSQPAFVFASDDGPDAITQVSHLEFGRAIHRAAHIARPSGSGQSGSVVVVIAQLDVIVYQALVMGLMRAGLVPFPISPRNSAAAIVQLLKATSCHRVLATPATLGGLLEDVQLMLSQEAAGFALDVEDVPLITQLYPNLGKEDVEYQFKPYPPLYKHLKPSDVALYLHSSGSTGFPKAIPQSVQTIIKLALHLTKARKHEPRLRFGAMALPSFHFLGFMIQVVYPIFGLIPLSVFPPAVWCETDQPPPATAEGILLHLRRTGANSVVLIPMMLEGMSKSLENTEYLRKFEVVAYCGGPMPKILGESLVSSGINLQGVYGSTEAGSIAILQLNRDPKLHWEWLKFGEFVSMRWEPQGDGTFEGHCLSTDVYYPAIENLEDTRGYATSDLFVPHPTLERHWRIVGRKDDVIIHSSGEKTVPALMEGNMTTNSIIQGAVMFGHGHDQAGVLVEPVPELAIDVHDPKQLADFRTQTWPIIENANVDAPAFSKIFKEMILVASSDKPLPRTAKGTIMRKAALQLYEEEIETLYKTIESNSTGENVLPPESWDRESLQDWLLQQATNILSHESFDPYRDIFEQGFDSLSATILRLRIAGALKQVPQAVNSFVLENIIYAHPVIDDLASRVAGFFLESETAEGSKTPPEAVEAMIEKYSEGLTKSLQQPVSLVIQPTKHVVFITGTTGNLGSQILAQLLRLPDVTIVYALNRISKSSSALKRLETRFVDKGLDMQLLKLQKLILLEGDLANESFGLPLDVYTEIQNAVTVVIHAAWRLDFNLTLASFERSIQGTRNLIDCIRCGPHPSSVRFLYTSSIGLAQGWDPKRGPFPEEIVDDPSAAIGNGYGESKYVAEQILANSGLHATSLRIGQISGGLPNGAWSTSDWVPILIKSSLELGALPNAPGNISWIPMDAVAQCIVEMAFSPDTLPTVINLVHPRPVSWSHMLSYIREELLKSPRIKNSLSFVPFHEWFSWLEERSHDTSEESLRKLPAIKLLNFFRKMAYRNKQLYESGAESMMESGGFTAFAIDKARRFSPTLRGLHELSARDAERWIKYWSDQRFFES